MRYSIFYKGIDMVNEIVYVSVDKVFSVYYDS